MKKAIKNQKFVILNRDLANFRQKTTISVASIVMILIPLTSLGQTKNVAATGSKVGTSTTTEPTASAQTSPSPSPTPSATPGPKGGMAGMPKEEQVSHHEKMAGMHTKMVECLKSSKPAQDCHQEMNQSCAAIHKGTCPMPMDSKGKGMGKAMMGTGTGTGSTKKGPGAGKGVPKGAGKAAKGGSGSTGKTGTGTGVKASKPATK